MPMACACISKKKRGLRLQVRPRGFRACSVASGVRGLLKSSPRLGNRFARCGWLCRNAITCSDLLWPGLRCRLLFEDLTEGNVLM